MSLPHFFDNYESYFHESVAFFNEYQYLYMHSNTDVLVEDILNHIDIHGLENTDVYADGFTLSSQIEESNFLKDFYRKLNRLEAVHNDFDGSHDVEVDNVPLAPKKRHEVKYLAKEIRSICEESQCNTIVDFGSGLGYLDQLLFSTTNYQILGLECNESHYVGAKKRQRKYHENSIDNVKYIRHTIKSGSHININEYLTDKFTNPGNICIVGLHACADLTIDAIDIFLKMQNAQCLIVMPCCYHKMATHDGRFKNFPLSPCLRDISNKYGGHKYMNVPFLRVGAQPPNVSDVLENLVFNLMARGVLQLYAHKRNCKLKRNKRKVVKIKTLHNDFEYYVTCAVNGFTLIKVEQGNELCEYEFSGENSNFDVEELKSLWSHISELTFKKAAIFILLQNCLQPVIENFILFDRLVYLNEKGFNNCRFKKIFDGKISPRCLALIANK